VASIDRNSPVLNLALQAIHFVFQKSIAVNFSINTINLLELKQYRKMKMRMITRAQAARNRVHSYHPLALVSS